MKGAAPAANFGADPLPGWFPDAWGFGSAGTLIVLSDDGLIGCGSGSELVCADSPSFAMLKQSSKPQITI